MASPSPPVIFSSQRRSVVRKRMLTARHKPNAPDYILSAMVDDVLERISFLRFEPTDALIVGDHTGVLAARLREGGAQVTQAEPADGFDEERPYPRPGFDFIVSLGTLDTVNDLPGALIHIRNALRPGGMMIASMPGAGSLSTLRQAMLTADGERPAPRVHPQIDVRAGGQLLQRADFADPVIDSWPIDVAFRSFDRLVADLRAQGLSNVLADPGPPLGKGGLDRARAAFAAAGEAGRTIERFEILTLSGWRSG